MLASIVIFLPFVKKIFNEMEKIMEDKEILDYILNKSHTISVATSVNNTPNVRLVSFIFDENKIYFTSFKGRPKNDEFDTNSKVAFTTENVEDGKCVRVSNAICKRANVTLESMKDKFINRHPGFEIAFEKAIDKMDLFEITFEKADVIVGFGQTIVVEI